ncbi:iron-sulfur cluster assembly protein [Nitrosophilus labii]|uniref:iron-sulfur cluster assembly protein n=1 Tax=Nitrosophilus labii TaxID=2706014 RepID=UPI00165705AD|nr:iron-sulfur cluster assembly protein [Nitrosophilus labii]
MDLEKIKEQIIEELKNIYDPEIPVNIYDLGLIYDIDCKEGEQGAKCKIDMTLTSAFCPAAESIVELVKNIKNKVEEIEELEVNLVFDPPWDKSKMSDEAKLHLGML